MPSTLFGRLTHRAVIRTYVPEDSRYQGERLSAAPSEIRPYPGGFVRASVGTLPMRAVAATFARLCADKNNFWAGFTVVDLNRRLHNEADRAENGQAAILEAAPPNRWFWQNKRRFRDAFYRRGLAFCLDDGMLRSEVIEDEEVIFATDRLVDVFMRSSIVADLSSF